MSVTLMLVLGLKQGQSAYAQGEESLILCDVSLPVGVDPDDVVYSLWRGQTVDGFSVLCKQGIKIHPTVALQIPILEAL